MVSNAGGTAMNQVTGASHAIMQYNASGVPVASTIIDGGTY